jgi:phosphoribosylaminoimidazole-succinocarboxamide synthase
MRELDEWLRHRLPAVRLKQWRRGTTMFRELRKLRASVEEATTIAANPRRWWGNSRMRLLRRCRSPTSTAWEFRNSPDLNFSNRPARTRVPGGAGDWSTMIGTHLEVRSLQFCAASGRCGAPASKPRRKDAMEPALMYTTITSLPLVARGKVRDIYAVGEDRLLMVATDRLSAFDVVMNQGIPGKGKVLTEMALFWFAQLGAIVPNHLTGDDPESVVRADEREQVRGRSMLVKRLRPLPIEAVVRGYLAGSAWKEYEKSQSVCGIALPPGLRNASKLPYPIFTPATKAESGDHDENIDFERMCAIVGTKVASEARDVTIKLYETAAAFAIRKKLIIADTKLEFGLDENGLLILMDELLTPDSSRYWPLHGYAEGGNPSSYDKQYIRDWLETTENSGTIWNKTVPAPMLSENVISCTIERYSEALQCLRG